MYRAAQMTAPESTDVDQSSDHLGVPSTSEGADLALEKITLKLDQGFIVQHALDIEFAIVCRNPLDGIYIIPSASDPLRWFGMLFVRRGEYAGAILRFTIQTPIDFPDTEQLPVVRFENEVFHPNVNLKTHELHMQRYFPDGWKKNKHHLYNVLLVIQRIFFSLQVPLEHAANPEAAILFESDKNRFHEMVLNCVNSTRIRIYDDPPQTSDPNSIWVSPWNSEEYEPQRQLMMLLGKGLGGENQAWSERGHKGGFSWVDAERMTYMTEPYIQNEEEILDKAAADRAIHGIERLDLSTVTEGDDVQEEVQVKDQPNDDVVSQKVQVKQQIDPELRNKIDDHSDITGQDKDGEFDETADI